MIGKVASYSATAALVLTLGYALAAPDPCERCYRAVAPWRVTMDVFRGLTQNWFSQDSRLEMLMFSVKSDAAIRGFVAKTFYGDLQCKGAAQ